MQSSCVFLCLRGRKKCERNSLNLAAVEKVAAKGILAREECYMQPGCLSSLLFLVWLPRGGVEVRVQRFKGYKRREGFVVCARDKPLVCSDAACSEVCASSLDCWVAALFLLHTVLCTCKCCGQVAVGSGLVLCSQLAAVLCL